MADRVNSASLLSAPGRVMPGPVVAAWLALATLTYVAAAALVRLFDDVANRAQLAQLVEQGGPLMATTCTSCAGASAFVLAALTDWRALLIWGLVAAGAVLAVVVTRRPAAHR